MVGLLAHRWQLVTVTSSNGLRGILSSMYFQPSFCLEKAEYLSNSQNFAFAMVCFADLLNEELPSHMKRFHSISFSHSLTLKLGQLLRTQGSRRFA